jgi:hypothetical protein
MFNLLIAMSSGVVNFHEQAGHRNQQPAPGNERVSSLQSAGGRLQ